MKKIKMFLVLVGIALMVSGCTEDAVPTSITQEPETPVEAVSNENTSPEKESPTDRENRLIVASEIDDEILSWHKVSDYVGDLDGDNKDEEIVLATTAECNKNGEFIWNDGQDWALYVIDGSEKYLLFNEYINAGYPYMEIADYYMEDGAKPQINVVISTGASFILRGYSYQEEQSAYAEEILYSTKDVTAGGINTRFSSFPEYQKEVKVSK